MRWSEWEPRQRETQKKKLKFGPQQVSRNPIESKEKPEKISTSLIRCTIFRPAGPDPLRLSVRTLCNNRKFYRKEEMSGAQQVGRKNANKFTCWIGRRWWTYFEWKVAHDDVESNTLKYPKRKTAWPTSVFGVFTPRRSDSDWTAKWFFSFSFFLSFLRALAVRRRKYKSWARMICIKIFFHAELSFVVDRLASTHRRALFLSSWRSASSGWLVLLLSGWQEETKLDEGHAGDNLKRHLRCLVSQLTTLSNNTQSIRLSRRCGWISQNPRIDFSLAHSMFDRNFSSLFVFC